MKTRTVNKLFTVLMVFVMMLSATMVLQWSAKAEENHVGTVEGIVKTQDGAYPSGVEVNLIDISQDEVLTTYTESGGYFRFDDVNPGHHIVKIPSQQQNDEMVIFKEQSEPFQIDDGDNVDRGFIEVESADLDYTVSGEVTNSKGEGIPETQIILTDTENEFTKSYSLIDEENGTYEFMAYESEFILKFKAPNYKPYTRMLDVNETFELPDITLKKKPTKPVISGFLWESGGSGVDAPIDLTIYNETRNVILHEKISKGPYFEIGAVEGEYTIVLKAEGYKPKVIQENVNKTDYDLGKLTVETSNKEDISTEIQINDDWQGIQVTRERTIQPGSVFEAMDYEYLGSLKMQIDFAFGNRDLTVSQSEIETFRNQWLENREGGMKFTQNLITVGDTDYEQISSTVNADLSGLEGSVMNPLESDIQVISDIEYTAYEEIDEGDQHIVDLMVKDDYTFGNKRDYTYTLNLPDGYERVKSEQEIIPSSVDVSGYTDIDVNPKEGEGRSHVRFDIRKSEEGEASIVLEEAGNVYLKEDDYYIIRQGTEVKGEGHFEDPVSEAESYTWYLGEEKLDIESDDFTHTFTGAGEKPLKLVVKDTGGDEVTASVTVMIDGEGPIGTINADNTTVDEGQEVVFSASEFVDEGEIRDYEWNFSDDSDHEMGVNVTHVFGLYGTYDVKVNVTDVVGNWNVESKQITVKDITDPVPKMKLTQDDEEISVDEIEKGKEVTFNGSESYDPAGYEGDRTPADELNITWMIEGPNMEEEVEATTFTHTFEEMGQFTLKMDVEDHAGNNKTLTRELSVSPGPIPNLELTQLNFSKNKPEEGDKVTITANVTNYGSADAESITVRLNDEVFDGTITFYDGDEETDDTIPEGENRLIKFEWKASSEGKKNIRVNITDAEEPTSGGYTRDNSMQKEINVQPPAWREYIVYALIPIIIIGVSVGLYFYRDKFQK
ncbi:MAG: PKD domain-containing protein [Thermoplasmatota archaeon]